MSQFIPPAGRHSSSFSVYQSPSRGRSFSHPTAQPHQPRLNHGSDPIKAAAHLQNLLFSPLQQRQGNGVPISEIQVYIFTMNDHFLVMMSPGQLPFVPFTHTADGLYQVNPLYQKPFFRHRVSYATYQAIQKEASGLDGIPPLMILKGTWNETLIPPHRCHGKASDLIFGHQTAIQAPEFSLQKVPNSWTPTANLQGVAYSLGDKRFRVWFHEKNPQSLTNAMGEKRDEIKELKKLQSFLVDIPAYRGAWHADLFKTQAEIDTIGQWRNLTTGLIEGHPDKERAEPTRRSTAVQEEIKTFNDKRKEIKKCRKKPLEKAQKEGELEVIRVNLTTTLKIFLDESMAWIEQSPLSTNRRFMEGLESSVDLAERELGQLQAAEPKLAGGNPRDLESMRCPTSAYRSTMQIESSTENMTERQRLWVYIPTRIELADWYLRSIEDADHRDAPPVSVSFFEKAVAFLEKKERWVSQHGFSSQMDGHRFLNLVRYQTKTLHDVHYAFKELRKFFTNAPVPQRAAGEYPHLKEEATLWEEFQGELEKVFKAASPNYSFQFYQETTALKEKLEKIIAGGTLYKRVNAGGNVDYEFQKPGERSKLNVQNRVHTPLRA